MPDVWFVLLTVGLFAVLALVPNAASTPPPCNS
jgi:hypothetical protein